MSKQPEALRLADALEQFRREAGFGGDGNTAKTIAELRRLHSLNAELEAQVNALRSDVGKYQWKPMRKAPRDGLAVLVLIEGSDIPRAVRWLSGRDDRHATKKTTGPGWYMTWDGTPIADHSGPRFWMYCPDDPDVTKWRQK